MKKSILRNLFIAAIVIVAAISCKKETAQAILVGITADETFSSDKTAEITLNLSAAAGSDIIVTLASSGAAAPATTALPGSHVSFPQTVTIMAGSTSASVTATLLNTNGLGNETYSVGIQILAARGAEIDSSAGIAFIKLEGNSYGNGGGEGSGEGGESTPGEGSESGWSVSYDGFGPFTYTNGGQTVTEDCEIISYVVPAGQYVYLTVFEAGAYEFYVKGQPASEIISLANDAIADELSYYEAGTTAADLVYAGPDEIGYEEFANGDYEAFIFGTDANGNPDGRYAWCSFTKTGSSVTDDEGDDGDDDLEFPDDITSVTLKSNWSLSFTETFKEDGIWYDEFLVSAPGSKYVDLGWFTDEDLAEFDSDLDLINFWQYYCYFDYEEYKDTPSDYFYVDKENAYDSHEAGTWTVYLIEFNADWTVTGNYGKCTVTVPVHATADSSSARPLRRNNFTKNHHLRARCQPGKLQRCSVRRLNSIR